MFHWHLGPPCRFILRRIAKFYHQKWYYAADSSGQNIHPNILRHTHLFTFMYRSSFSLDTCYLFGLSWYALFVWSCFLDWLILTWLASGKKTNVETLLLDLDGLQLAGSNFRLLEAWLPINHKLWEMFSPDELFVSTLFGFIGGVLTVLVFKLLEWMAEKRLETQRKKSSPTKMTRGPHEKVSTCLNWENEEIN